MRRFKTQEEIEREAVRLKPGAMPTDKKLIIYGRQSTKDQVYNNKESTEQQTTDLLALGLDYGWKQEDTTLYIENRFTKDGKVTDKIRNASGTLRIDQRPGLNAVKQRIEEGQVGAVLVWDVSRLFRDEDMIEPAIFAKLCKDRKVLILTNDDMFDFTISRRNDRKRFMDEAQAAADFITKHVKKMNLARDKVASRGEYAGGVVPVGFTVAGKQLTPYPPHAEQVAYLFRRFREIGGVLTQLGREVYNKPIFPEVPEGVKPPRLTRVSGGGYTFNSYVGLKKLLTNPVYIGHLSYNGRMVKENAHPAIVDESDFWYAFNLLSETDTKGNPINRPQKAVRYQQHTSMPTTALLQGTRLNGAPAIRSKEHPVYLLAAHGHKPSYTIINPTGRIAPGREHFIASILADDLDRIVSDFIVDRVEQIRSFSESFTPAVDSVLSAFPDNGLVEPVGLLRELVMSSMPHRLTPYDHFQAVAQEGSVSITNIDDTLSEYQSEISRLDREYRVNFDLLSDRELRENRQKKNRLISQIEAITRKHEQAAEIEKALREGEDLIQDAPTMWHSWSIEKRQKFIGLATEDIILDKIADGWLRLVVVWSPYIRHYQVDVCYIWRGRGGRTEWTERENDLLREHYQTARSGWLLEQLPDRTWGTIRVHARELGLSRPFQPSGKSLPNWMSYNDRRLIDRLELSLDEPGKRVWWLPSSIIKSDTISCQSIELNDINCFLYELRSLIQCA